MRLTPLDIRKQEFKKAMRGLETDEVHAFLATVADEYEAVLNDNKALRERVLELDDKVQEYRNMEKTLRDTLLTAERDPIKDLDLRLILAALIGRDFIRTPGTVLSGQLGMGYLTEEDIFGVSQESAVAIWTLRYRQDVFTDDLEIYHDHSINSYVTGRNNLVIKTSTGVRYEITDLLYANLAVDYDYESEPAGTAENDDLGIVVGLGVEF